MKTLIMLVSIGVLVGGCASERGYKAVRMNSNPPGARVLVYDREGTLVASDTTPARPLLRKYQGCLAERYKVVFEKPGYYPSETWLESTPIGWYTGDFGPAGPQGIVLIPGTDINQQWARLPGELNRNLIPSSVKLGAGDLRVLNRIDNAND